MCISFQCDFPLWFLGDPASWSIFWAQPMLLVLGEMLPDIHSLGLHCMRRFIERPLSDKEMGKLNQRIKNHFQTLLGAKGGSVTQLWPRRCKWKSIGDSSFYQQCEHAMAFLGQGADKPHTENEGWESLDIWAPSRAGPSNFRLLVKWGN